MQKWKGDVIFLLVVGALIAGWIYLYPKPRASVLAPLEPPAEVQALAPLSAEESPVAIQASYASPEGLKLAYRLFEPAEDAACVLVLLHDTLLHGGWYANLGRDLAAQGIAVYLPDRRGGENSRSGHT